MTTVTLSGSGTWVVPSKVERVSIGLLGGGGGGSGHSVTGWLEGGGGGGYSNYGNIVVTPGQSCSYYVGSGGGIGDDAGAGHGGPSEILGYSAEGGLGGDATTRTRGAGGAGDTANGSGGTEAYTGSTAQGGAPAPPYNGGNPGRGGGALFSSYILFASPGQAGTIVLSYYETPTPTISGINPSTGPTTGGTSVVITGTGFANTTVSSVKFGATSASFVVNSATQITATAPAKTAGAHNVTVTTGGGTSNGVPFTYVAPPAVTSISPSSGPCGGGTNVTIYGSGFTNITDVSFSGSNAWNFGVNSSTQMWATSPDHSAGITDVQVGNAIGYSATVTGDRFTYQAPTVTGRSPISGSTAGGTSVVITGTNFNNAEVVHFGTTPCYNFTVNSNTQITAISPAKSAGLTDIRVTAGGSQSANTSSDNYTYVSPPTITGLSVAQGPSGGGTSVIITGTNFTGASAVKFGSVNATSFVVNSSTQITAVSPAQAAGLVDIEVTNGGIVSSHVSADRFTFISSGGFNKPMLGM